VKRSFLSRERLRYLVTVLSRSLWAVRVALLVARLTW
jgi:hypothetical protein